MNEIEINKIEEVAYEMINCYEIGKKFGRCGTQILHNLPFNEEDDIAIPEECRSLPETKQGIRDGVKEVFDALNSLQKIMNPIENEE